MLAYVVKNYQLSMTCLFALKKGILLFKIGFGDDDLHAALTRRNNGSLATHAEKNRAAPETW